MRLASSSSITMSVVARVAVLGVVTCWLIFLPTGAASSPNEVRDHEKPVRWEVVKLWGAANRQRPFSDDGSSSSSFNEQQKTSPHGQHHQHQHEGSGEEEWLFPELMAPMSDDAPPSHLRIPSFCLFLIIVISSVIAVQWRY